MAKIDLLTDELIEQYKELGLSDAQIFQVHANGITPEALKNYKENLALITEKVNEFFGNIVQAITVVNEQLSKEGKAIAEELSKIFKTVKEVNVKTKGKPWKKKKFYE